MNVVLSFLHENRQRLDLERYSASGRLSSIVLTPRFRASRHVLFLVLAGDRPDPVLVAKVPRLGGASRSLEREVANLRAVQGSRMGGFDSIPRVIAFEEYCGRPILVETALVGKPMDPETVRRDLKGCCAVVLAWLAELQRPLEGVVVEDADWFERLVERPLAPLAEVFPAPPEEARLLERTGELVASLREADVPLVFEHGDLSHPNVRLLKNGRAGVVDWELADPHGLPACDLFFFLTYAAFSLRRASASGGYVPAFHEAFFGAAAWARPYVLSYAEQTHLPMDVLTPLFVLCWARYVAGLVLRLGDEGDSRWGRPGPETAAWLRANRYFALWKHSLDHIAELDWRAK